MKHGMYGPPDCTKRYHPMTGGTEASYVEGHGETGDKGISVEAEYMQPTEEGVYNHAKVAAHGNYPHSPADPKVGGPPLGSTEGGPTHSNY